MIERRAVDNARAKVAIDRNCDEAALRCSSGDRCDGIRDGTAMFYCGHNPSWLAVASMFECLDEWTNVTCIQRVHAGA